MVDKEIQKRNRNNKNNGRRIENEIAKFFDNAMRIGAMGGEDILHADFSIECKHRKTFAGSKFLEQSERNTKKQHKTSIAVVHTHGQRIEDSIVLIRLKDFIKLVNDE